VFSAKSEVQSKRVQKHVSTQTTPKKTSYEDCAIDPAVDLTEKPIPQSKPFPFFLVTFAHRSIEPLF